MAGFTWYLPEGFQVIVDKTNNTKSTLNDVQMRFLCPDDLEEVRALCREWFPIEYPHFWYEEITSSDRFFALAAVVKAEIIGLIVVEIKPYLKLNEEDKGILSRWFASKDTLVAYILTLGVSRPYRRAGVASALLDVLIAHLAGPVPRPPYEHRVKALFLHVLTTNSEAILFYEHRKFRMHSFLPYYYSINGQCKDGFTYVSYVNGGHAPWTLYDYVKGAARAVIRGGGLLPWMWETVRTVVTRVCLRYAVRFRLKIPWIFSRRILFQPCPANGIHHYSKWQARHRAIIVPLHKKYMVERAAQEHTKIVAQANA